MRFRDLLVAFSLMLLVLAVAAAQEGMSRKAYARFELAEVYFERGSDTEGYTQLKRIMADFPGTDADYQARKRMVERLMTWADGNPPSGDQIDRVRQIVHEGINGGNFTKFQCIELAAHQFVWPILGPRITRRRALQEAEAILAILDSGPPADGPLGDEIAWFWYGIGCSYPAFKQYDKALWAHNQAITRYPTTLCGTASHVRLGSYYVKLGDLNKAEEHFRAPLDGRQPKTHWEAHYYLGDFLVK